MDRDFCISLPTDNLKQTIDLYEETLGLEMRPLSNAIAMFKVGSVDIQVCQSDAQDELLGLTLSSSGRANVMMTKFVETSDELDAVREGVRTSGYVIKDHERIPHGFTFCDGNGVTWLIEKTA
jgi:catechol 2,3-dioxygenase-like lactoylglutathione lyase family enzyme